MAVRIMGFNGSPHRDGITVELLQLVLDGAAQAGAETRLIHLYDLKMVLEPGTYSRDPKEAVVANHPSDGATNLFPEIVATDGLVFATPVYWLNMSGAMKLFIDHLTALEHDGFQLQGKVGAFIAASRDGQGQVMAAMSMVAALGQMGLLIPPNSILWYPGKWSTAGNPPVEWAKVDAPKVGRYMVELIQLFKEHPIDWER